VDQLRGKASWNSITFCETNTALYIPPLIYLIKFIWRQLFHLPSRRQSIEIGCNCIRDACARVIVSRSIICDAIPANQHTWAQPMPASTDRGVF